LNGRRDAGGILLTGGASARLGFDKTLVDVAGVPCARRTAGLMEQVLAPLVEVGTGCSGLPSVREEPPGSGPLAALAAGGDWLRRRGAVDLPVVVVAGDLPLVTVEVLAMLRDWPGEASVVPVVEGRAQPLLARWSQAALEEARRALVRGERALRTLVESDNVELVEEATWPAGVDASVFADIDTPEDLERLGLGR
jgi:molybdopterin-guanine dinucleotide biosynthesis protein A